MDCPFCHKPMREGLLQSTHQIFFSPKNRSGSLLPRARKGDVKLTSLRNNGALPANYCPDCRKLIASAPEWDE